METSIKTATLQTTGSLFESNQQYSEWLPFHAGPMQSFASVPMWPLRNGWLDTRKKKKDDALVRFNHLYQQYPFQAAWRNEGLAEPTPACIEHAQDIYLWLSENHQLNPERIAPTGDESILLYYRSAHTPDTTLSVEIFNEDLDVVCVVSDGRSVIFSQYIAYFGQFHQPVRLYLDNA